MGLTFRVYKGRHSLDHDEIQFMVSSLREPSFREDIRKGEFLIDEDSLVLIHETSDRNEARAMATEF